MDLRSMKRRELQALCKSHGLPANSTNAQMIESLAAVLDPPPPHDSGKPKGCLKGSGGGSSSNEAGGTSKKVSFSAHDDCVEFVNLVSDTDEDYFPPDKRKFNRRHSVIGTLLQDTKSSGEAVFSPVITRKRAKMITEDVEMETAVRALRNRVIVMEDNARLNRPNGNTITNKGSAVAKAEVSHHQEQEPIVRNLRHRQIILEATPLQSATAIEDKSEKAGENRNAKRTLRSEKAPEEEIAGAMVIQEPWCPGPIIKSLRHRDIIIEEKPKPLASTKKSGEMDVKAETIRTQKKSCTKKDPVLDDVDAKITVDGSYQVPIFRSLRRQEVAVDQKVMVPRDIKPRRSQRKMEGDTKLTDDAQALKQQPLTGRNINSRIQKIRNDDCQDGPLDECNAKKDTDISNDNRTAKFERNGLQPFKNAEKNTRTTRRTNKENALSGNANLKGIEHGNLHVTRSLRPRNVPPKEEDKHSVNNTRPKRTHTKNDDDVEKNIGKRRRDEEVPEKDSSPLETVKENVRKRQRHQGLSANVFAPGELKSTFSTLSSLGPPSSMKFAPGIAKTAIEAARLSHKNVARKGLSKKQTKRGPIPTLGRGRQKRLRASCVVADKTIFHEKETNVDVDLLGVKEKVELLRGSSHIFSLEGIAPLPKKDGFHSEGITESNNSEEAQHHEVVPSSRIQDPCGIPLDNSTLLSVNADQVAGLSWNTDHGAGTDLVSSETATLNETFQAPAFIEDPDSREPPCSQTPTTNDQVATEAAAGIYVTSLSACKEPIAAKQMSDSCTEHHMMESSIAPHQETEGSFSNFYLPSTPEKVPYDDTYAISNLNKNMSIPNEASPFYGAIKMGSEENITSNTHLNGKEEVAKMEYPMAFLGSEIGNQNNTLSPIDHLQPEQPPHASPWCHKELENLSCVLKNIHSEAEVLRNDDDGKAVFYSGKNVIVSDEKSIYSEDNGSQESYHAGQAVSHAITGETFSHTVVNKATIDTRNTETCEGSLSHNEIPKYAFDVTEGVANASEECKEDNNIVQPLIKSSEDTTEVLEMHSRYSECSSSKADIFITESVQTCTSSAESSDDCKFTPLTKAASDLQEQFENTNLLCPENKSVLLTMINEVIPIIANSSSTEAMAITISHELSIYADSPSGQNRFLESENDIERQPSSTDVKELSPINGHGSQGIYSEEICTLDNIHDNDRMQSSINSHLAAERAEIQYKEECKSSLPDLREEQAMVAIEEANDAYEDLTNRDENIYNLSDHEDVEVRTFSEVKSSIRKSLDEGISEEKAHIQPSEQEFPSLNNCFSENDRVHTSEVCFVSPLGRKKSPLQESHHCYGSRQDSSAVFSNTYRSSSRNDALGGDFYASEGIFDIASTEEKSLSANKVPCSSLLENKNPFILTASMVDCSSICNTQSLVSCTGGNASEGIHRSESKAHIAMHDSPPLNRFSAESAIEMHDMQSSGGDPKEDRVDIGHIVKDIYVSKMYVNAEQHEASPLSDNKDQPNSFKSQNIEQMATDTLDYSPVHHIGSLSCKVDQDSKEGSKPIVFIPGEFDSPKHLDPILPLEGYGLQLFGDNSDRQRWSIADKSETVVFDSSFNQEADITKESKENSGTEFSTSEDLKEPIESSSRNSELQVNTKICTETKNQVVWQTKSCGFKYSEEPPEGEEQFNPIPGMDGADADQMLNSLAIHTSLDSKTSEDAVPISDAVVKDQKEVTSNNSICQEAEKGTGQVFSELPHPGENNDACATQQSNAEIHGVMDSYASIGGSADNVTRQIVENIAKKQCVEMIFSNIQVADGEHQLTNDCIISSDICSPIPVVSTHISMISKNQPSDSTSCSKTIGRGIHCHGQLILTAVDKDDKKPCKQSHFEQNYEVSFGKAKTSLLDKHREDENAPLLPIDVMSRLSSLDEHDECDEPSDTIDEDLPMVPCFYAHIDEDLPMPYDCDEPSDTISLNHQTTPQSCSNSAWQVTSPCSIDMDMPCLLGFDTLGVEIHESTTMNEVSCGKAKTPLLDIHGKENKAVLLPDDIISKLSSLEALDVERDTDKRKMVPCFYADVEEDQPMSYYSEESSDTIKLNHQDTPQSYIMGAWQLTSPCSINMDVPCFLGFETQGVEFHDNVTNNEEMIFEVDKGCQNVDLSSDKACNVEGDPFLSRGSCAFTNETARTRDLLGNFLPDHDINSGCQNGSSFAIRDEAILDFNAYVAPEITDWSAFTSKTSTNASDFFLEDEPVSTCANKHVSVLNEPSSIDYLAKQLEDDLFATYTACERGSDCIGKNAIFPLSLEREDVHSQPKLETVCPDQITCNLGSVGNDSEIFGCDADATIFPSTSRGSIEKTVSSSFSNELVPSVEQNPQTCSARALNEILIHETPIRPEKHFNQAVVDETRDKENTPYIKLKQSVGLNIEKSSKTSVARKPLDALRWNDKHLG